MRSRTESSFSFAAALKSIIPHRNKISKDQIDIMILAIPLIDKRSHE
jgi:hypothetical protein